MRIVILGATGRTGHHLVEQGLDLGHQVTAFARKPAGLEHYGDRIRVVQGDIGDPTGVSRAVAGQEAVLSALGSPTIRKNTVRM